MTSYESYPRRSNSPSNAFHSTASTAFQPQPAYQQMATAAAAVPVNGQDYYQHQHTQPIMYMPPVSHDPPANPAQPSVMDHAQAQPGPVAAASPQSQSASPGREASSAPTARNLNNSKRAEQNRKAQRAFRERRDAHIKYLESRSELLDAALQQAEEANRRWEEARGVMDALKRENEILRRALTHQANNPAALGALALPPHNLPTRQLLAGAGGPQQQPNGQSADDQHPILSVGAPDASGPGTAGAGAAPNGVRALQERARELREEGARIEKIQVGARKRRRGAGPAGAVAGAEGGYDGEEEEDVPAVAAAVVPTNGKRKRGRGAQDAL